MNQMHGKTVEVHFPRNARFEKGSALNHDSKTTADTKLNVRHAHGDLEQAKGVKKSFDPIDKNLNYKLCNSINQGIISHLVVRP
jgi:hypothetical protein